MLTHERGEAVVLENPRENLSGAGRFPVDQHHHGLLNLDTAPLPCPSDLLGAVPHLHLDDHLVVHEVFEHHDGDFEQPARIAAEVDDEALGLLRAELGQAFANCSVVGSEKLMTET
ncbi:MAG: hypothetical protein UZ18_ATM001000249 [Armatimonadetes bacterium OLB18]|nr:MAG: hypothetical protein UZ18_ATM001000249 [Armatimonadetes bacterium OLB18]